MAIPVSRRLDFSEIPVIDLGPLRDGDAAQAGRTVAALERACSDIGFLYVRNHGVARALIERLVDEARRFFARPVEEKMAIALDQRMRGYLPLNYRSYEGEARAGTSRQEGFWIGHERPPNAARPLEGPNQWPAGVPGLKPAMLAYFVAAEELSRVLQRGFALALGLAPDFFDPLFRIPNSRLKLNHYPPQDAPDAENDIGVVPHADSGGFTILWQDDNGGLEVQSKSGEWVGAPPIDDTFVINLGNIMQIWTNGRFSSTPHRVINRGGRDRYSIPLFVNPDSDAWIKPLIADGTTEFEPFRYGTYQRDEWRRIFPIAKIPA
ncbi:MAG TPA: 2-oxoglutarate and iron-dependent oxygenase domain-containing protein [Stellaceae bacterium]|nr:2-oxoglutarate and iron-dependent oxygenase domain-containing protein [Stellaceae bacterium]